MRIINRANLSTETHADLERELPEIGTLQQFVVWGGGQQPPMFLLETVALDEYTHEVIAAWRGGLFLAFGSTWNGTITAVAVWDHKPGADELLAAKLVEGWRPTPSPLREGDQVLGHAVCLLHWKKLMARGWESKSVEDQLEEQLRAKREVATTPSSTESIELRKMRETLLLNRSRLLEQLQNARSDAHRRMLEESLRVIEAELAAL